MRQTDKLKSSLGYFLRTMFDLMVLNGLWFLCSLPLVTIGPATCALYSVTLKLARDEDASAVKGFFLAFRDNLKAGFLLELMALVLGVVAGVDAWFALQQTGLFQTVYLVVAVIIGAVFLTFLCYTFPLQAMFRNSLKVQIKNAFALAFVSPVKTIMLWLITLFPIAAALLLPRNIVGILGFLYLMVGFSGPVFLNSRILRDVFDKVNGSPVIPVPTMEED